MNRKPPMARGKSVLISFLIVALTCGPALADGRSDAQAGLVALRRGDNAGAVVLFNKAIASGVLAGPALQLVLAKRSQAPLRPWLPNRSRCRRLRPRRPRRLVTMTPPAKLSSTRSTVGSLSARKASLWCLPTALHKIDCASHVVSRKIAYQILQPFRRIFMRIVLI